MNVPALVSDGAVARPDGVIQRPKDIDRKTLHDNIRARSRKMAHRGRPDVPFQVRAEMANHPGIRGELANLFRLEDPPVLARVDADQVRRALADNLLCI